MCFRAIERKHNPLQSNGILYSRIKEVAAVGEARNVHMAQNDATPGVDPQEPADGGPHPIDALDGEVQSEHIEHGEPFVDFPIYLVESRNDGKEVRSPKYYRLDGVNGPLAEFPATHDDPIPCQFYTLLMSVEGSGSKTVELIDREDTPWSDYEGSISDAS